MSEYLETGPFLQEARKTFTTHLLALVRWHAAAGCRDYVLFTNYEQFETFVAALPESTNILVFPNVPTPDAGIPGWAYELPEPDTAPEEWLIIQPFHSHTTRRRFGIPVPFNVVGEYPYEIPEPLEDVPESTYVFVANVPFWNTGDYFFELVVGGKRGVY